MSPVIFYENAYFYFGGRTDKNENDRTIARLDAIEFTWFQARSDEKSFEFSVFQTDIFFLSAKFPLQDKFEFFPDLL